MQKRKSTKSTRGNGRLAGIFIVVVSLVIAGLSINLFVYDLTQTIYKLNETPVGFVIERFNNVTRQFSDMPLRDRLTTASEIYIGDIIYLEDNSSLTINLGNNIITMVDRSTWFITRRTDGEEGLQVNISGAGRADFTSLKDSVPMTININGIIRNIGPDTNLSVTAREDGEVEIFVTGGSVRFQDETGWRTISSGEAVAFDAAGTQIQIKTVVVTYPARNANYIKNNREPLGINFSWNRVNFTPEETLRLEIAQDRNFSQNLSVFNDLNDRVQVFFDTAGIWHWRLFHENTILFEGRITAADSSELQLITPAPNSELRFSGELPVVNFQWSLVENAESYLIEIADNPGFLNPHTNRQWSSLFYSGSTFNEGTWYWRIRPVFPSIYTGTPSFSPVSVFRLVQIEQSAAEELENLPLEEFLESVTLSEFRPRPQLISPVQGESFPGLTAMQQQTVFRWNFDGDIENARLVLSRNPDPFLLPDRVIQNPGTAVGIDNLGAGTWFWNVEIQTRDGFVAAAPEHEQFQVLPIPSLSAPQLIQPVNERRYAANEIRTLRNIVFTWRQVPGANMYQFNLFRETTAARPIHTAIITGTSYNFTEYRLLGRGTFVWQVMALNRRSNVNIQTGEQATGLFVLDFPVPAPVQIEDMGTLYGFE